MPPGNLATEEASLSKCATVRALQGEAGTELFSANDRKLFTRLKGFFFEAYERNFQETQVKQGQFAAHQLPASRIFPTEGAGELGSASGTDDFCISR